ncbi:hypothetical protein AN964_13120 [Heyndrickxia shackletonii]|uniref:Uncharacterized protein n=1 Tax=Heyndrickxia shackletonii TaxID=157838 RepID=A0A0Q3WZ12_9BACI|nr:hypothetical protein [Heyndrickxia shackletonii]KQL54341.1 hypothetical protein AN964_13120 [Heyndrickxia shackletonii]NEZ01435.1 hypothetical protein [Heyndrickxia shackletonii]
MRTLELYKRYLRGERFKGVKDLNLNKLSVGQPSDLIANSIIMQEMARKHSKFLNQNGEWKV